MVSVKVYFPGELKKPLQDLQSKTGGHLPFLSFSDSNKDISSGFLEPTLYPHLTVPNNEKGDWAEVAFHIAHLNRALSGIPELRVYGNELANSIARSFNAEIEWLAAVHEGLVPPKKHESDLVSQVETHIKKDHSETLNSQHVYLAFRLENKIKFGLSKSNEALELLSTHFPDEARKARLISERINKIEINTLLGKVEASKILLEELGFDKNKFYFQETMFSKGFKNIRSLDYYEALNSHENTAANYFSNAFIKVDVQLPFHLPALQGCYIQKNGIIVLKNNNISNSRSSWESSGLARFDSIMDPSGLYKNSFIQVFLPGIYDTKHMIPPHEKLYKNHKIYPKYIKDVVILVNDMISYLRKNNNRCDIPDVTPLFFNKVEFIQYDEDGNIDNKVSDNFECIRLTRGIPKLEHEILTSAQYYAPPAFYSQLLESSKLHLLQNNARRAIIDFCGAIESFVSLYVDERIIKSEESIKDRFLRLYRKSLSPDSIDMIENLNCADDSPMPLPLWKKIDIYRKEKHDPKIDKKNLEKYLEYLITEIAQHMAFLLKILILITWS